eukprot:1192000-Alexandrium_andersonii.AAC.1
MDCVLRKYSSGRASSAPAGSHPLPLGRGRPADKCGAHRACALSERLTGVAAQSATCDSEVMDASQP